MSNEIFEATTLTYIIRYLRVLIKTNGQQSKATKRQLLVQDQGSSKRFTEQNITTIFNASNWITGAHGQFFLGWRYGSERARRAWLGLKWVRSLRTIFKILMGPWWRSPFSHPGQTAPPGYCWKYCLSFFDIFHHLITLSVPIILSSLSLLLDQRKYYSFDIFISMATHCIRL